MLLLFSCPELQCSHSKYISIYFYVLHEYCNSNVGETSGGKCLFSVSCFFFYYLKCLDRGWSAYLIFKQNTYNMSFAIYFDGNMIKLWCVHLRSHCLQWFLSIELITLLEQAKHAVMLYVLSKCCYAIVAMMLWLNCLCNAKNSKQLSAILSY